MGIDVARPPAPPPQGRRRLFLLALVSLLAAAPVSAAQEQVVTARLRVAPIVLGFELAPSSVRVGQTATARAIVTNATATTLRSVTVTVRFEPVGLMAKGGTMVRLSQLKGGKSAEAAFQLCGAAPGAYLVLVQAEVAGIVVESPARLLSITAGTGKQQKC